METEVTFVGSICRICLQLISNRYDIVKSGLHYLFAEFTGINIVADDGLPAVMCPSCVYILNKAVRFRRKCFETNFYLHDFIRSGQTEFDADKTPTAPYLTLHTSETVVCEIPSTTCDTYEVLQQPNDTDDVNQEYDYITDFVSDFEPFSVNGISVEPVPQKIQRIQTGERLKPNNHENDPETDGDDMRIDTRSILEVPLNNEGHPDVVSYFGTNLGQHASIEYEEKDLNKSEQEMEQTIENVTLDEKCLYVSKRRKLTKVFKAHDGTVITTKELMGPQYLRIEHLTIDQQLAELEKTRHSEKYLSKPYKCVQCALSFPMESQYTSHLQKHEVSTGPYQCSLCTVRFNHKDGFQRHNYSHRMKFVCVICEMKMGSRKMHAEHVMSKHIGLPKILCLICNKKYRNYTSFKSHNKWHHGGNTHYQCPHCPQRFKKTSPSAYHKHILKHAGKGLPYPCTSCPKKEFVNFWQLKHHQVLMHGAKKIRCENCKRVFSAQSSLDKHVNKGCVKPFNFYQYECDQCSKVFCSQAWVQHHKAMVHEEHKVRCDTCNKTFPNEQYLKKHNRVGSETATCPHCDKKYCNYLNMASHIRNVHKLKPPKSGIKRRSRRIVKKKKTIQVDPKRKIVRKNLPDARHVTKVLRREIIKATPVSGCKKHIAHCTEHRLVCVDNILYKKDTEKFDCDFCRSTFTCQSELQEHLLTHTSYSCRYCESVFEDYASVYCHLRFNHVKESSAHYKMCNCIPKAPTVSLQAPRTRKSVNTNVNDVTVPTDSHSQLQKLSADQSKAYYSCKYCGSLFKDYVDVLLHMQDNHAKERKLAEVGQTSDGNEKSEQIIEVDQQHPSAINSQLTPFDKSVFTSQRLNTVENEKIDIVADKVTPTVKSYIVKTKGKSQILVPIDKSPKKIVGASQSDTLTKLIRKQPTEASSLSAVGVKESQPNIASANPLTKKLTEIRIDRTKNISTTSRIIAEESGMLNTYASKIDAENKFRKDLLSEEERLKLNTFINKIELSKPKKLADCITYKGKVLKKIVPLSRENFKALQEKGAFKKMLENKISGSFEGNKSISTTTTSVPEDSPEEEIVKCEPVEPEQKDPLALSDDESSDLRENQSNDCSTNSEHQLREVRFDNVARTFINSAKEVSEPKDVSVKRKAPLLHANPDVSRKLRELEKVDSKSKIVLENALRPDSLSEKDKIELTIFIQKIALSKPAKTVMIMKVDGKLTAYTLKSNTKENRKDTSLDPEL